MNTLLAPFTLSDNLSLTNRIVMAPMTRSMATDALVPTQEMAEYYARRAETGLIITEATIVAPLAQGYPNTPGLFSEEQVAGWKVVTDRVHERGGKIFAQIWHCGRVSHPVYLGGELPVAPSAVALSGRVPRTDGIQYGTPRAMTESDITAVIDAFALAAANARRAGFDGVEIHGANGYLVDQFLHWETNQRTDAWGGSPENMSRFVLDVINAVKNEIEHVGIRLTPVGYLHMAENPKDKAVFDYLLQQLNTCGLSYVHTGSEDDRVFNYIEGSMTQYIRRLYKSTVIASGSYTPERAVTMMENGDADLVAIGRPLIANPDYVGKIQAGLPLTPYHNAMLNQLV
ncbi:alkene reductase [Photobacterium aphoticum]|uniref:NADH:flavin oxidoreductase n=1 Tax=Photobacterium aphoticum TaxID=754436 RepID=A0A0J1GQ15_9GAMM|nr:alkene reductase [Photobacterium aphoticum]KLV01721.1 NADH:flavin oxidoreductase [Photobacterium aphoticum]PSU59300.1 alkene reductase [Photobacterium aphoticum]